MWQQVGLFPASYFQARLNGPGNEARVHGYCSTTQLDYIQKTCKVRSVYKNQIRAKQENSDTYMQMKVQKPLQWNLSSNISYKAHSWHCFCLLLLSEELQSKEHFCGFESATITTKSWLAVETHAILTSKHQSRKCNCHFNYSRKFSGLLYLLCLQNGCMFWLYIAKIITGITLGRR